MNSLTLDVPVPAGGPSCDTPDLRGEVMAFAPKPAITGSALEAIRFAAAGERPPIIEDSRSTRPVKSAEPTEIEVLGQETYTKLLFIEAKSHEETDFLSSYDRLKRMNPKLAHQLLTDSDRNELFIKVVKNGWTHAVATLKADGAIHALTLVRSIGIARSYDDEVLEAAILAEVTN